MARCGEWAHRCWAALLACCLLLTALTPSMAWADIPKSPASTTPEYGLNTYFPDQTNSYPYDSNPKKIGVDSLFGGEKGLTTYNGEVPTALHNEEGWQDYRFFAQNVHVYHDMWRAWGEVGGDGKPNKFPDSDVGIEYPSSGPTDDMADQDYHIQALTTSDNFFGELLANFSGIGFSVVGFFYSIAHGLLTLMIQLVNVDLANILTAVMGGDDTLHNAVMSTFLINPDTGTMSPLMVIALSMAVVGVVVMVIRWITSGNMSLKEIGVEAAFICLSMIICFGCMSGSVITSMSKATTGIAQVLVASVGTSTTDVMDLYSYSTGNDNEDAVHTSIAITKKPYIDMMIQAQFGVDVNELELNSDNFGDSINTSIAQVFTGNSEQSTSSSGFSVSNNSAGTPTANNLGYYWWCADSNVNTVQPLSSDGNINTASPHRVALVVDLMQAVRVNEPDNAAVQQRLDTMYNHLTNPNYPMLELLFLTLVTLAEVAAVLMAAVYCLFGKVIVVVGSFFIPVAALLMIARQTRKLAKDVVGIYLGAFLRMVVGMLLVNLVVLFNAVFCASGMVGMMMALVLSCVMFAAMPTIFRHVGNLLHRFEPDTPMSRFANNWVNRVEQQRVYGRGGNRFGMGFGGNHSAHNGLSDSQAAEANMGDTVAEDGSVQNELTNVELNDQQSERMDLYMNAMRESMSDEEWLDYMRLEERYNAGEELSDDEAEMLGLYTSMGLDALSDKFDEDAAKEWMELDNLTHFYERAGLDELNEEYAANMAELESGVSLEDQAAENARWAMLTKEEQLREVVSHTEGNDQLKMMLANFDPNTATDAERSAIKKQAKQSGMDQVLKQVQKDRDKQALHITRAQEAEARAQHIQGLKDDGHRIRAWGAQRRDASIIKSQNRMDALKDTETWSGFAAGVGQRTKNLVTGTALFSMAANSHAGVAVKNVATGAANRGNQVREAIHNSARGQRREATRQAQRAQMQSAQAGMQRQAHDAAMHHSNPELHTRTLKLNVMNGEMNQGRGNLTGGR